MPKFRVYISQVNQTFIDVEARDEEVASAKAERECKRVWAEPYVMSVKALDKEMVER